MLSVAAGSLAPVDDVMRFLDDPAAAWMNQAACAGAEPSLFLECSPDPARALDICTACSVRAECARWAGALGETTEIWGGKCLDA